MGGSNTAGAGTAAGGALKMYTGKTTTGRRGCSSAKIRNSRKNNPFVLATKLDKFPWTRVFLLIYPHTPETELSLSQNEDQYYANEHWG